MIIVNQKEIPADNRPLVTLKTVFQENAIDGGKTQFGTVVIPPKARVPLHGNGAHDQDEYSIVVKGSIISWAGGKEYTLAEGDATLIPAGEEHWAYNDGDEDCEIVWALVKR